MLNIIKSDFFKLGKNRTFFVCTLLCAIFAILMVVGLNATVSGVPGGNFVVQTFSGVGTLAFFTPMGFHLILIAVFASTFVAAEFHAGTVKI